MSTSNGAAVDEEQTYVIFLDSFGTQDLEHTPWIRENLHIGALNANPVYVTPVVLGSIYTGKGPGEHGLPAVSRYDQDPRLRPAAPTIPEIAAAGDEYENVLQLGLPFIVPPQTQPSGLYWHESSAMGNAVYSPQQAQSMMMVPTPAGEIDKPDENMDLAFDLRVDYTHQYFGNARNLTHQQESDLTFVSYRILDSYCHNQFDQPEDGDKTYRELLLEEVDRQVKYMANTGRVFVFGDHGARTKERLVRINRWLIEHGYLEVEIDHEWREKAIEYDVIETDESVPGQVITMADPGVTVDEEASVAIGADPFSSGLTLLDGADEDRVQDLIDDLEAVDGIGEVFWARERWDGPLIDEAPDLYAYREPGTFVSGNLAPEPGGPEVTRSGVHDVHGAFASSAPLPSTGREVTPTELFDVITDEFLGLEVGDVDVEMDPADLESVDVDDREVAAHLEDLGYL